jgi:hypothetical protein
VKIFGLGVRGEFFFLTSRPLSFLLVPPVSLFFVMRNYILLYLFLYRLPAISETIAMGYRKRG